MLSVALGVVLAGCAPRAPEPLPLEQSPAERAKLLTIPDEYRRRANPLPATEAGALEGRARYLEHCAQCHGQDGRGGTVLGRNLHPPAGDVTAPAMQKYSDGELFWIVAEGVRFSGMPSYRNILTEEQMWKVVHYLRQLR